MRVLFLLRHAKSSWSDPDLDDHDRPLTGRGERAAGKMAAYARSAGLRPDLVLCSSARRARATLEPLLPVLAGADVEIDAGLYGAAATDILGRLRDLDDSVGSVLVIGHNPGLQDLAVMLAGDGDDEALAQLGAKFPTAALATLEIPTTWHDLAAGEASLRGVVLPRRLPA